MNWQNLAACRNCDPNLFFPARGNANDTHAAKQVCHTCPVQKQCLDYAIGNDEQYGIWGGMNLKERDTVARRRRGLKIVS